MTYIKNSPESVAMARQKEKEFAEKFLPKSEQSIGVMSQSKPKPCPFMPNETARKLVFGNLCIYGGEYHRTERNSPCHRCMHYNQWKYRKGERNPSKVSKARWDRIDKRIQREGTADFLWNGKLERTGPTEGQKKKTEDYLKKLYKR